MKKIIIPIINTGIGNLIMILPLLENITNNKKIKCTVIVNKEVYKIILQHTNFFQKLDIIEEKNIQSISFWLKIRKQGNIIFSPTVGIKPLILWKLLGFQIFSKPYIIKNKFYLSFIETYGIPKFHEVEDNLNILKIFYKKYPELKQEIILKNPILKTNNIKEENIIYIHPGFDKNSNIPKDWGIKNWIDLIQKLILKYPNYKLGIIIGPGYEEKFYPILKEVFNNNVFFLYKEKFQTLLEKLQKGKLLINSDSGIGHISGALGLKTITLFGPADEKQSSVYSNKSITIRKKGSKPTYSQGIWIGEKNNLGGLDKIKPENILDKINL